MRSCLNSRSCRRTPIQRCLSSCRFLSISQVLWHLSTYKNIFFKLPSASLKTDQNISASPVWCVSEMSLLSSAGDATTNSFRVLPGEGKEWGKGERRRQQLLVPLLTCWFCFLRPNLSLLTLWDTSYTSACGTCSWHHSACEESIQGLARFGVLGVRDHQLKLWP